LHGFVIIIDCLVPISVGFNKIGVDHAHANNEKG